MFVLNDFDHTTGIYRKPFTAGCFLLRSFHFISLNAFDVSKVIFSNRIFHPAQGRTDRLGDRLKAGLPASFGLHQLFGYSMNVTKIGNLVEILSGKAQKTVFLVFSSESLMQVGKIVSTTFRKIQFFL